jgi:2-iminobutanoate/2-iminopropanoate deaminase
MEFIHSNLAPRAVGPYSQAANFGNLVFCSGQIGLDPKTMEIVEGGVLAETKQIFKNIKAVLNQAGSSLDRVLKVEVLLDNMGDFKEVNELYAKEFNNHKPARTTYEVSRLPLGAKIEITVTAAVYPHK